METFEVKINLWTFHQHFALHWVKLFNLLLISPSYQRRRRVHNHFSHFFRFGKQKLFNSFRAHTVTLFLVIFLTIFHLTHTPNHMPLPLLYIASLAVDIIPVKVVFFVVKLILFFTDIFLNKVIKPL